MDIENRVESILVFHSNAMEEAESEARRGLGNRVESKVVGASEIAVATLQKNMRSFLTSIDTVVGDSPKDIGGLELQEIEIQAEIDGKGNIGISALAGVGIAVRGGIKFILRKKV